MAYKATFSLDEANSQLPLVVAIAAEITERRKLRRRLIRQREGLEAAATPEGLTLALSDLDARIFEQDQGLERCQQELRDLGLVVLRTNPLTVHFPGETRNSKVVFCWQEGERSVGHGHAVGEEQEPRRPLKVRITDVPRK
ncbi:MAG: DUF2203 family protein [Planctomycetota bacterium]|jgi:hypothetical protein